jgi:pimeloyl-ACP methyl ester carboxylesterase
MMDWNKDQRALNQIEDTADEIWQIIHDAGKNDNPKYSSFNPISKEKGLFGQSGKSPEALDDKKIQHAAAYHYRVYGAGYNWLNSNLYSANGGFRVTEAGGEDSNLDDCLNKVIDSILADIQAHEDPDCKQVILVTHSMGGLVGRAYQAKHSDKVLGVIHGVMPATGAAPMYKRMRAGFGGVENPDFGLKAVEGWAVAKVLGDDAYKTSVVLTHAVGAIELAPSDSYGDPAIQSLTGIPSHIDHKAWLRVHVKGDEDGIKPLLALPITGDPYKEIYESSEWYGLLPYIAKENPTELQNKRVDPMGNFNYLDKDTGKELGDLAYFRANVIMAKTYHMLEVTKEVYHPESYAQCFVGKTDMEKAFGRVVWQTEDGVTLGLKGGGWRLTKDDAEGKLELQHLTTGQSMNLSVLGKARYDYGDATVPAVSGMAPAPYAKILFEQNDGEHDHQSSWNSIYAQRFAVYAATCLIQKDKRAES